LQPQNNPNRAHSASGTPCAPAEVVNTMRSRASAGRSAATTWLPPPAAMVITQRSFGFAATVRARAAGLTSGMPYSTSASSSIAS